MLVRVLQYEGVTRLVYYDSDLLNWNWTLYSKAGKHSLDANLLGSLHHTIKAAYFNINQQVHFSTGTSTGLYRSCAAH